ncbi:PTS galactitol transporter subunit IIC [Orenia metallireducens]|uniref:PTS galactitol transporter subunit IIC n=1 Tax=Orenia metallireducens TaxID=1413210 RepID=A0A1C0ABD1_9FIRM|nr:PTS transporter subunit IIC [Orenia metallireducens]OCL27671.1 PTS galactitol transporter subunit IIC [Orenia metallireducens]
MFDTIINYILDFPVYVMLPIVMFTVSLIIQIPIKKAMKHALTLGIGFIGIFMTLDHFVAKIAPVIEQVVEQTGSDLTVLDVGWPPLAATAWSFKIAPILMVIFIVINIIMLWLKLTNTFNIDIWNFWHFLFTGQLVYTMSQDMTLSIISSITSMVIIIKLADWSAEATEEFSGITGISITTLSATAYYPIALATDKLIEKIPKINRINGNPEHIQKRLGFFGEPMFIGLLLGIGLGIIAGYNLKEVADLAINIAAVVFILPRMAGILGEGLMPISTGAKNYLLNKFPGMEDARIGMDLAVLIGYPAVIVAGIILMPIALILAILLPGIKFIPLADLPNMIGAVTLIVVATRGNLFRAVVAFIPIIIGKLYIASAMSSTYTNLLDRAGIVISQYKGNITSFLDGGNLFRIYWVYLFQGNIWAIGILPIVSFLIYITWKEYKKRNDNLDNTFSKLEY